MDIFLFFILVILKALGLTIVIELIALFLQKERNKKIYYACIYVNIITNVSLNIILQIIPSNLYFILLIGLEILIVMIEAIIYNLIIKDLKKAIRISLICNSLSFIIGFLLIPFIY